MSRWRVVASSLAFGTAGALGWFVWSASAAVDSVTRVDEPGPQCSQHPGISVPAGFCVRRVAELDGEVLRHLVVADNGDVFVASRRIQDRPGGLLLLREDSQGDLHVLNVLRDAGGTGVARSGDVVLLGANDAILRYEWPLGNVGPTAGPDTIVSGLVAHPFQHNAKSLAVYRGWVYVNIGAPSNACQVDDRQRGSPGQNPCPLLEDSGGIWRFSIDALNQSLEDGVHVATGIRNAVALTVEGTSGQVMAVQHGRDDLAALYPELYDEATNAEVPSEEFWLVGPGDDFGWPYCHYDPRVRRKVLAPEYGGNGLEAGRCAQVREPDVAFPAHWAPNAVTVYDSDAFPDRYRGGAFVAFHGSWNRAPEPQGGYNVAFVPFSGGRPIGGWEVFADGFGEQTHPPDLPSLDPPA